MIMLVAAAMTSGVMPCPIMGCWGAAAPMKGAGLSGSKRDGRRRPAGLLERLRLRSALLTPLLADCSLLRGPAGDRLLRPSRLLFRSFQSSRSFSSDLFLLLSGGGIAITCNRLEFVKF